MGQEIRYKEIVVKKVFKGIWHYLKDWKNLLGHTLIGIGIILISAVLPLPWWARLIVLVSLIVFNIFRERLFAAIFRKKTPIREENLTDEQ
jgi:diacylglycerol kinase